MECKQVYNTGMREYMLDSYNLVDFTVLSLYLASYTLRFLVDRWINTAQTFHCERPLDQDIHPEVPDRPLDQHGSDISL